MNFSMRQLRAFIAVAQHASFTKAAEQFHITQAGLSAMVRELEEQLDSRLFERTTRAVRLTPAGEHLLPIAQRAVRELGDAAADLAKLGRPGSDRVRIGVTPLIACSVIPEVLKRFHQQMPQARVDVIDLDRALIQQRVERGELDAGFGAFFSRVSGIRRRAMFPSNLVLAMPRTTRPLIRAVHWKDIERANLISLPPENAIQQIVDRHLAIGAAETQDRRTVTHLESAMALVEAGLGQALMPSFAALASKRWRVHFATVEPQVSLDYYCVTRAGRPESPLVNTFAGVFSAVAVEYMK
jgi:DNA-binding transcriptional LysR family regulator